MDTLLIVAIVAVPIVIVWMVAVVDLMTRHEDEFRGSSDKLAWAIILTFAGFLGAIVYFIGRPRNEVEAGASAGRESAVEEPCECLKCGTAIPVGAAQCPSCGWSYSQS